MPGLFGDSLFGKQAPTQGLDSDQAQSLGIIQAMQQSQQAGMQRTASPIGSIAQNLLPIFGALIYSQAAQAQAAKQQQQAELDKQEQEANIAYKKALTDKATRPEGPEGAKNLQELLARRIQAGQPIDDVVAAIKQTQKPAAPSVGSLIAETTPSGDPNEMLQKWQQFNASNAGQRATATAEANAAIKKPLTRQQVDEFSSGIDLINTFDRSIEGFKNTTGSDVVASTLTHGMMSNDALRAYNKVFNDIDNQRAGARGMTAAALERVRSELPPPQMALFDPPGFMRQFKQARSDWYDVVANRVHATAKRQDVDESLLSQIANLAPKGVALPGTDTSKVDVDEGLVPGMRANFQKLKKAGYSRDEAKKIMMKRMGLDQPAQPQLSPVGVPDAGEAPEDVNND